MALLDFLKKKREKKERKDFLPRREEGARQSEVHESMNAPGLKEKNESSVSASGILRSPHLSEKANESVPSGIYAFKVESRAGKGEIKRAVEELYGVQVRKVNLMHLPSKTRFVKGRRGRRPGYKKALIYLEKGQTIERV